MIDAARYDQESALSKRIKENGSSITNGVHAVLASRPAHFQRGARLRTAGGVKARMWWQIPARRAIRSAASGPSGLDEEDWKTSFAK